MAEQRWEYRHWHHGSDLIYYRVTQGETDLHIGTVIPLQKEAEAATAKAREMVKEAIRKNPVFMTSLNPLPPDPDQPHIAPGPQSVA